MKKQLFGAFLLLGTLSITSCGLPPKVTKEEFVEKIAKLPNLDDAIKKYSSVEIKGSMVETLGDESDTATINERYTITSIGLVPNPGTENPQGQHLIVSYWIKTYINTLDEGTSYHASSSEFAASYSENINTMGIQGSESYEYKWNADGLIVSVKSDMEGNVVTPIPGGGSTTMQGSGHMEITFNWGK